MIIDDFAHQRKLLQLTGCSPSNTQKWEVCPTIPLRTWRLGWWFDQSPQLIRTARLARRRTLHDNEEKKQGHSWGSARLKEASLLTEQVGSAWLTCWRQRPALKGPNRIATPAIETSRSGYGSILIAALKDLNCSKKEKETRIDCPKDLLSYFSNRISRWSWVWSGVHMGTMKGKWWRKIHRQAERGIAIERIELENLLKKD